MKYPYRVVKIQESDGEIYWVAKSESLKGCIGTGETPEEAARELEENEIAWLEAAQEFKIEIPEVPVEREEEYSGKFTARVSPAVHRKATEQAKKQGISLNQYVNDAIVNYTAELNSSDYISTVVAIKAQEIAKRSLSGTSYSKIASHQSQYTTRTEFRYKQ